MRAGIAESNGWFVDRLVRWLLGHSVGRSARQSHISVSQFVCKSDSHQVGGEVGENRKSINRN